MVRDYPFLFWCRNKFINIKTTYIRHAAHFNVCGGLALLGLILALFQPYAQYEVCNNFIFEMRMETYNPVKGAFMILIATTLVYLCVWIAGCRFSLYILFGYGGVAVASYLLWKSVFISSALSGFYGMLYLILYIVPVFLWNTATCAYSLHKVYASCGYAYNRRLSVGVWCQLKLIFCAIRRNYGGAVLFNFLWWLFLFSVFSFIF